MRAPRRVGHNQRAQQNEKGKTSEHVPARLVNRAPLDNSEYRQALKPRLDRHHFHPAPKLPKPEELRMVLA